MGKITVETCEIEGLKVITPTVFGDERGYFMETYNYNDYKAAGIDMEFVQDNQSSSKRGVLRGLHFQINYPQDKLVRVVSGEVFDVAVDLREGSPTFGKWHGVILSAENKKQFFIVGIVLSVMMGIGTIRFIMEGMMIADGKLSDRSLMAFVFVLWIVIMVVQALHSKREEIEE